MERYANRNVSVKAHFANYLSKLFADFRKVDLSPKLLEKFLVFFCYIFKLGCQSTTLPNLIEIARLDLLQSNFIFLFTFQQQRVEKHFTSLAFKHSASK